MAAPTPMSDFNKSSAKIAQLIVKICNGNKSSYKYKDKRSGKEVTANKFECFLLGEKEDVYMYGFLKGTERQVNDAANKFKDGQVFKLSKISLDTWTSTTSISSPKAFRLNLEKTTCQQIAADDALAQQIPSAPVPPRTVGETAKVTTNKALDLLAVVKAATNKRTTRDGVDVIDAVLIDDSRAETGELATVLVSVWGDRKVYLIENNVGKPLAFFNLTIKMDAGDKFFNHYPEALLLSAPVSEKTKHLLAEASTLTAATNTVRLSSEKEWHPHESPDVSGPQPLCCAAFLDLTAEEPAAANMPSVVQIPWLLVEEPARDEDVFFNEHGGRLWFVTTARDCSGAVRVGCPQRIALALAHAADKEDFKAKHDEDSLGFPLFVHARLTRSVKQGSGHNAGKEFVSNTLQDVVSVSWTKSEAPNASFNSLLTILNNLPGHDEAIQFCYLKDIKPDPHYGFSIEYDGQPGPRAAYAVVLVESLQATTTHAFGDGFKAETQGIRDVAFIGDASKLAAASSTGDAESTEVCYRAIGFSNLDGIVKLDPPRGKKSRFAVLLVDKIDDDMTMEMQKAEFVEPADAVGAVTCFQRLRQVCKQIKQITPAGSAKRTRSESESFVSSPKDLKKCRTLTAVPTDASIDA